MNPNIEFSIKTAQAYNAVCKPLCQELGLSQTALDILLFLANNPDYKTARDIVEVRHIKANLVSMNVDKLGIYKFYPVKTICHIFLLSEDPEEFRVAHDCRRCTNTACNMRKEPPSPELLEA